MNQRRKQQMLYMGLDFLSSVLVWVLFLVYRWAVVEGRVFGIDTMLVPAFNFYRALILYPISCLIIYYLSGYYLRPFDHNLWRDFYITFISAFIISFGAFFIIIIDDPVVNYRQYYVSLIVLFSLQLLVSYIPRVVSKLIMHIRIIRGNISLNTLVIGNQHIFNVLKKEIRGKNIVAFLSIEELDKFASVKKQYHIEDVIIALPKSASEHDLYKTISTIYPYNVGISFPARIYDMLIGAARIHTLTGSPLVTITDHNMSDSQICIKHAFDVSFAFVCLLLLSPLYLLIALAIRIDSKGSVIYTQERIGLNGRPFKILKFRTMQSDAETDTPLLSKPDDPRITKIGRLLRKYRLDELPQLWNVLRGDMSIVGPRPERQYYINQIVERAPYYCLLYKIRPGLTSWGPIRVGYTDNLDKMISRLNYDIVYMENMSLILDLKIMFFTIKVIFDGKGQ